MQQECRRDLAQAVAKVGEAVAPELASSQLRQKFSSLELQYF